MTPRTPAPSPQRTSKKPAQPKATRRVPALPRPTDAVHVGIVGCGNIAQAYFNGCAAFEHLKVVACADLDQARAKEVAEKNGVEALGVKELLAHPDVHLVVNLTIPAVHAKVNRDILTAGKHAYTEKPFTLDRKEGLAALALAKKKKLFIGGAPDTILGGGVQTVLRLLQQGLIGRPLSATTFRCSRGPEHWHPRPEIFYARGGGPLLDVGPYDITGMVTYFGPIKAVQSVATAAAKKRPITNQINPGQMMKVEVPTHVCAILETVSGVVVNSIWSFDVWAHNLPMFEIHGEKGAIVATDLNTFGGQPKVKIGRDGEWQPIPLTHSDKVGRGIGVADMAQAILGRRKDFRVNGALAYHVFDVMQTILDAAKVGKRLRLRSTCARPKPLPDGLAQGKMDG
jgi:predicted dehydrogenase